MKPGLVALLLLGFVPAYLGQGSSSSVQGRIIVEPTYPASFAEELSLTFTDVDGRAVVDVIVSERVKTTSFRGRSGDVKLQKDGTFQLLLPNRELRLIVRQRSVPRDASTQTDTYFLKSAQAGGLNLLEKTFIVGPTFSGEIVITFGKCTPQTQAECVGK
jgi:hypothetical protein